MSFCTVVIAQGSHLSKDFRKNSNLLLAQKIAKTNRKSTIPTAQHARLLGSSPRRYLAQRNPLSPITASRRGAYSFGWHVRMCSCTHQLFDDVLKASDLIYIRVETSLSRPQGFTKASVQGVQVKRQVSTIAGARRLGETGQGRCQTRSGISVSSPHG